MNDVFRALNDPTRREILVLLNEKSLNAGEISDQFDMKKPSISHHLELLRQAKLIKAEKKGQFIFYSIEKQTLIETKTWFEQFLTMIEPTKKPRIRINLSDLKPTE